LVAFFSARTHLNFFAEVFFATGFLTSMNLPDDLLRLVQALAPPNVVVNLAAPFHRTLAGAVATGLFPAMSVLLCRPRTE